jgi:thioredoxin-dependent peroxiredoxin
MGNKKVIKGEFAPSFEVMDSKGASVRLEAFKGKKVWLAFFRYASCPLCNMQVASIIRNYPEFEKKGIQVLAVFQSSPESIEQSIGSKRPPFPLLADPDEKLYQLYGLETSWLGTLHPKNLCGLLQAHRQGFRIGKMEGSLNRVPGDFLIDEEGRIHTSFYGEKIGDHLSVDEALRFSKSSV